MTEMSSPHISSPRIMVLKVQPGAPPFRIVEIDGEMVAEATGITDVLQVAAVCGILTVARGRGSHAGDRQPVLEKQEPA
ncbi:hypothetical protein [Streptomyces prunicolor]|uniref:hypothetical protein n=1 Tax=Streptomyces prunicolor TaxID=67348 RepID=UPI0033EC1FF0